MEIKYTKDICLIEAKKYKNRGDFRKYSRGFYDAASKKKWLDQICAHMEGRVKRKAGWWNDIEHCKEVALLYETPTQLCKAEKGCYDSIILNNWQDVCFRHMRYRAYEYTIDDLKQIALKCKTYKEFRTKHSSAYQKALKIGILNEICQHIPSERKCIIYDTPLTYENCKRIALKFDTISDFIKYEKGRWYNYAIRHSFKDEICGHMRVRGNLKKRCIYVARFSDNFIYVGLTYDTKRRWSEHLSKDNSAVYLHIQETGLKPKFEVVHGFVDTHQAQKMEAEYEKKYIDEGWNVLNRAPTGSVGAVNGYSKQEVLAVARQYNTLKEFREKAAGYYEAGYRSDYWEEVRAICKPKQHLPYTESELEDIALHYTDLTIFYHSIHGAYEAARKMGILERITTHMTKYHRHMWTDDEIFRSALQCKTIKEFRTEYPREYDAASHRKILKQCCAHMEPIVVRPKVWTEETLHKEAHKYSTRKEFRRKSPTAYYTAKRRNLLDDCCSFMPIEKEFVQCNNMSDAFALALKCQNRTDFKKSYNKAYEMLRRTGNLNEACKHMLKSQSTNIKWTLKARADAARSCTTRKEFHDRYPWAHHLASINKGELDKICAHMAKSNIKK